MSQQKSIALFVGMMILIAGIFVLGYTLLEPEERECPTDWIKVQDAKPLERERIMRGAQRACRQVSKVPGLWPDHGHGTLIRFIVQDEVECEHSDDACVHIGTGRALIQRGAPIECLAHHEMWHRFLDAKGLGGDASKAPDAIGSTSEIHHTTMKRHGIDPQACSP